MPTSFYVYYRIADGAHALAGERVVALLQRVREQTGVHGRILHGAGEPDLWMEVYEQVTDASRFEKIVAASATQLGFADVLLQGSSRHVESFEEAHPCV
jgi:hypothetical protein